MAEMLDHASKPGDSRGMNFTSRFDSPFRTRKRHFDGFESDRKSALRSRFDYRIRSGFVLVCFIIVVGFVSIDVRLRRSDGQPARSVQPAIQRLIATDVRDYVFELIDIPLS